LRKQVGVNLSAFQFEPPTDKKPVRQPWREFLAGAYQQFIQYRNDQLTVIAKGANHLSELINGDMRIRNSRSIPC
jgi:hypothetical protein